MTVQPGTDLAVIHGYKLTTNDLCDGCGSRAYIHLKLAASGGELMFCHHHWHANRHVLAGKWAYLNDETQALFDGVKDDQHVIEGKAQTLPPPERNHGIKE